MDTEIQEQEVAVDIHVPEPADHEVPGFVMKSLNKAAMVEIVKHLLSLGDIHEPNNTEIQQQHTAIFDVHVPEAPAELPGFVKKNLEKVPGNPFRTRPVTIFRFPAWFHEINKDLCEPKAVSIGPYHRGKESLRAMEEHKWSTLRDFLARNENVGCEEYLQEMRMLEAQARECYSDNVNMASNDFVMMLLLDGCFILEYLINNQQVYWNAIFDVTWIEYDILSDLFLMENQLPFFVLHKLFAIQSGCGGPCGVPCSLLQSIFDVSNVPGRELRLRPPEMSCSEINHLLHFFYSHMTPEPDVQLGSEKTSNSRQSNFMLRGFHSLPWGKIFPKSGKAKLKDDGLSTSRDINIPCVTELHEAGVAFRMKRKPRDTFDVSFENGTMEIPYIQMGTQLKIILWNVVGFEQTQQLDSRHKIVSSYLGLMDSLINTEKDVVILERAGIIDNYLQNEEEAATFFNQFGRIFILDYSDHYLYDVYKELKRYSESTLHKSRARLMHDYFNNPWSAISVVAATVLLILTFLQTYFSAPK